MATNVLSKSNKKSFKLFGDGFRVKNSFSVFHREALGGKGCNCKTSDIAKNLRKKYLNDFTN